MLYFVLALELINLLQSEYISCTYLYHAIEIAFKTQRKLYFQRTKVSKTFYQRKFFLTAICGSKHRQHNRESRSPSKSYFEGSSASKTCFKEQRTVTCSVFPSSIPFQLNLPKIHSTPIQYRGGTKVLPKGL
jgi:hypothetical protein